MYGKVWKGSTLPDASLEPYHCAAQPQGGIVPCHAPLLIGRRSREQGRCDLRLRRGLGRLRCQNQRTIWSLGLSPKSLHEPCSRKGCRAEAMALPMLRPCLRRGRCTSLEAHLALLVQRISACYDNKAARLRLHQCPCDSLHEVGAGATSRPRVGSKVDEAHSLLTPRK